jgi:hypothetical protein
MQIMLAAMLTACATALLAAGAAQGAYLEAGQRVAAVDLAYPYDHHHYHRGFHFYWDRYSREELTRRPIYAFHPHAQCRTTVIKRRGRTETVTYCD